MNPRHLVMFVLISLISSHPFCVGQQAETDLFPTPSSEEEDTSTTDDSNPQSEHQAPLPHEKDKAPSSAELIDEPVSLPVPYDTQEDVTALEPPMERAPQPQPEENSLTPSDDETLDSLDYPVLDKIAVDNLEPSSQDSIVLQPKDGNKAESLDEESDTSFSTPTTTVVSELQSTPHESEETKIASDPSPVEERVNETVENVPDAEQRKPVNDPPSNQTDHVPSSSEQYVTNASEDPKETIEPIQPADATKVEQSNASESVIFGDNVTIQSTAEETESAEPTATVNKVVAGTDDSARNATNDTLVSTSGINATKPLPSPEADTAAKDDAYIQPVCGVWGTWRSRRPVNLKALYLLFENVELGELPRAPIPSAEELAGNITDEAFAQAKQGRIGTTNETKAKSANSEFVDGLDDIGKFFEDVDPPDELDVGAVGSSIQEVLMGQGTRIILKRLHMGYLFVRKYCALAKVKLAQHLLDDDGNLAFVDQESLERAARWVWNGSKRLFREAQTLLDNLIERGIAGGLSADEEEYVSPSSTSVPESNADVRELLRQYSRGTPKKY